MKILYAASEVAPFAKTGGLGDVAGALPVELKRLGHDIRVVMPCYRTAQKAGVGLEATGRQVTVPIAERQVSASILVSTLGSSVPVYLIQNETYYDRDELYQTKAGDYQDNAERFIFFSKAILDVCRRMDFAPDIIHCNDWQTGLAPLLLSHGPKRESALEKTRTVFTIHNLAYQGIFWHLDLPMMNLGWEVFHPEVLEFYGKINLMKAGIVAADAVTTVSKKYAQEIQTSEYGYGLEGVLQARSNVLSGILNGADYNEWSPQKDRYIGEQYSPGYLAGKKICRADLLNRFGLSASGQTPVLGMISRLVDQKGMDLLSIAIEDILSMGCTLIVLGSGEEKYQGMLQAVQAKFPKQMGLYLGFDNGLAHQIEAGADMFLMPSRFEPCGLNQIYSMKYGTIPIVRATGGLDDTVQEYDPRTGKGNGFKFTEYKPEALLGKVSQTMEIYRDVQSWERLIQNAMACDFSWHASALEYESLYTRTLAMGNVNSQKEN